MKKVRIKNIFSITFIVFMVFQMFATVNNTSAQDTDIGSDENIEIDLDELGLTIDSIDVNLNDIDSSFAKDKIIDFVSKGIIKGFSDGTFRPNNPITRAEFLGITMQALDISIDDGLTQTNFTDVIEPWMIKYIEKARDYNIVGQNINGVLKFRPNDPVTRAEAVAILLNIAGIKSTESTSTSFSDVKEPWIKYIEEAKKLGIISGQTINGSAIFRPNDPISRAEAVIIIANVINLDNIPSTTKQNQTYTINISDFAFVPDKVTINTGDTITWINNDSVDHQIGFSDSGDEVKSDILNDGDRFSYTFDNAGTINYICPIHPTMSGSILIK